MKVHINGELKTKDTKKLEKAVAKELEKEDKPIEELDEHTRTDEEGGADSS